MKVRADKRFSGKVIGGQIIRSKRRIASLVASYAGMALSPDAASAQTLLPDQDINFTLRPKTGSLLHMTALNMTTLANAGGVARTRIRPIARIIIDDRSQELGVTLQRRTRNFVTPVQNALRLAPLFSPRSRWTRYAVQARLPLTDNASAALGWHGMKISNRGANVTMDTGDNRLRTRDWFLPSAAFSFQPAQSLRLTMDYSETLRAYGETGEAGSLAMTVNEFQALRRSLKPETQNRARLRADWSPVPTLGLSVAVQRGRMDDMMTFADGGILPMNMGSARIGGATFAVRHQLDRRIGLSLRYSEMRLDMSGAGPVHERAVSLETHWTDGPLHASLRLGHGSQPTFGPRTDRPVRVEGGVDYALALPGHRNAMTLSLRLTDPDGLLGNRFNGSDISSPLRATDQARALLAGMHYAL